MLSKLNSCSSFVLILVAFLLLGCFIGGAVYADGGGGQMPDPPPQEIDEGSGGEDGNTFADVILTILLFIV